MAHLKPILFYILSFTLIYSVECLNQNDVTVSERTGRLLSLWPFNFSPALSRQIFDMFDIVTDVAVLTVLGIPILGLVALGASVLGPTLSTGSRVSRNKRSSDDILERTKRAILYARNLFDVLANLEDVFQKYDIKESECQLKTVCEVHKKQPILDSKYNSIGNEIMNLIRMQKDLEEYEIIPFAKIIFGQYADAATYGTEDNDCDMVYSRCTHNLNELIHSSKKQVTEEERH